jgi:hypothetical protein
LKRLFLILTLLFVCQSVLAQNTYLVIKGNDNFENKTIDSLGYNGKHTSTKSLLEEVNNFSKKTTQTGFLEMQLLESKKTNDSTFQFRYHLGQKNNFIHIYIDSNSRLKEIVTFSQKTDTLKLLTSEVEAFMNSTLNQLERKGYSLAKLKLINFRNKKNNLYAELAIRTEKIRILDDIIINGYDKFPESHKKNIKGLYRNKVFNQDNLKKIQSDFGKFQFVTQTKYPEILFTQDSTKVYVYLEKAKPNRFDGFIGFNNDNEKKIVVNGYLDLQLQNILNGGEKISLFWKSDGKNQKTFNVSTEIPYLFKSPLGLKAQLNIFKQDSIFQNTQTGIDLGYYFNYNAKLFLGYQESESNDIQNTNNTQLSDFKNSFLTTHLDYSVFNPDDFLFPDKTRFFFKIGAGKRNSKQRQNDQFFTNLNISHNFYLDKKNIVNIKSENFYLNSESYVINELYRFGGINSIRGFNENSLQGNLFTSILSEYRYVASPAIYLHTIIDYGYYQDKASKASNSLIGLGLGFGLLTKNGLFNLIYANGSTKEQAIKLSNSIIHISFKSKF